MENAADALKMAADVLIFVIALSISIATFSEARQTSQTILEYTDKTNDYVMWTDTERDTYIDTTNKAIKVTSDEIYPTISRAFFDNYRIVFNNQTLYTVGKESNKSEKNFIDLESDELKKIAVYESKKSFLIGIMYGNNGLRDSGNSIIYNTEWFNENNIYFTDKGISGIIGSNEVTQQVGMYYKEDVKNNNDVNNDENSNVPEANKTKKRVITYILNT